MADYHKFFKHGFDDFNDPCLCKSLTHIVYEAEIPKRKGIDTAEEVAEGVKYRAAADIHAACGAKLRVPREWDTGMPEGVPFCQACLTAHEKNLRRVS